MTDTKAGAGVYDLPRHNESGAITTTWMVGHADRMNARRVEVTRSRLYPQPARVGPAWYWLYSYTADGGPEREQGRGLADTMSALRRRFPNADIVQTWKS